MVFIGPSPEAIAAMGSKSAAKALMEKAGVPLTPGYHGDRQEPDYLLAEARRIGFPVLIKAVSGGGGKGMRRVDRADDFAAALAGCRREAQSSFGDDRVLVEKYVSPARHIEVQVFGDTHGNTVYLFERDCSVQRRHQKVIEEAPAPGMTAQRRRQMGEAAVAAARAVNYAGAGTVEFIAAADGTFYFMEMNTRLQVEHPVTEMITGLDLVEWQLRVAARRAAAAATGTTRHPRPRHRGARSMPRIRRANSCPRSALSSTCRCPRLRTKCRIDTGVRQGDAITPYYDPMIAKLIVHGGDAQRGHRAPARGAGRIPRGRRAHQYRIPASARRRCRRLSMRGSTRRSSSANASCCLRRESRRRRVAWDLAMLAFVLAQRRPPIFGSPWDDSSGWRPGATGQRHNRLKCAGEVADLKLTFLGPTLRVDIGGDVDSVSGSLATDGLLEADVDGVLVRARAHVSGGQLHLFFDTAHHVFEWIDPYLPEAVAGDRHGGLVAPMPGRVIAVLVEPGARVTAGTALLVMEAMKMEHTVTAPADGTIAAIHHAAGDQVREGDELLTITPLG